MIINFKVDSSEVKAEIERRLKKVQQSENLTRAIAGDLENAIEQNFRAQGRQPRWQRLKDKTLKAKAKSKYSSTRILQGRGDLKKSFTSRYTKLKAVIGSELEYAAIHNYGGMAGRNRKVRIPQREIAKLTRRDERNINKRVEHYFA